MKFAILLSVCLSCFGPLFAQTIHAPQGFRLLKADGEVRLVDNYVKDDYTFSVDLWTGPMPKQPNEPDKRVMDYLADNDRTDLGDDVHFADGVYYGTSHVDGVHTFTVLQKEKVYKIAAHTESADLKKYSDWLLAEAKKNK